MATAAAATERRPIGELMSIITQPDDSAKINKLFAQNMKEVFTYAKADITNHLVYLSFPHAMELRSFLCSKLTMFPKLVEDLMNNDIVSRLDDKKDGSPTYTQPRLCKRLKDHLAHDDIYALGMSMIENMLHKDLKSVCITQKQMEEKSKKMSPCKSKPSASKVSTTTLTTAATTTIESHHVVATSSPPAVLTPAPIMATGLETPASVPVTVPTTVQQSLLDVAVTEAVISEPASSKSMSQNISTTATETTTTNSNTNPIPTSVEGGQQQQQQQKKQQQQPAGISPHLPLLNNNEASVIDNLGAIRGLLLDLKKDNKALTNKVNLLTTKVDNQGTELRNQAAEIRQLRFELKSQPTNNSLKVINKSQFAENTGSNSSFGTTIHPQGGAISRRDTSKNETNSSLLNKVLRDNSNSNISPLNNSNRGVVPHHGSENINKSVVHNSVTNGDFGSGSSGSGFDGGFGGDFGGGSGFGGSFDSDNSLTGNGLIHSQNHGHEQNRRPPFRSRQDNMSANQNHSPINRNPPIYGSKKASTNSIAGNRIVRDVPFFVGGLSTEMDENKLGEYIENTMGITPVQIELNRRNTYNCSFKVTVKGSDKEKLFCADAWEENIIVKLFRVRKQQHINKENQAPLHRPVDWDGINRRLYDAIEGPDAGFVFH